MRRSVSIKGLTGDDRGFALILTIFVISIIVSLTLQFNTDMRAELDEAANLSDGIKLACIARSGFDGALAVLYEDTQAPGNVETLHEDWAQIHNISSISSSIFDEGSFEVLIIDHQGRIQINKLVKDDGTRDDYQAGLLAQFLLSPEFDLDSGDVDDIIEAIVDWIDPGDTTSSGLSENITYEFSCCKNSEMESLEELIPILEDVLHSDEERIQELFYGSEDEQRPGIRNYLTVHGSGKININTADSGLEDTRKGMRGDGTPRPRLILTALAEYIVDTDDVVGDWIDWREDEKNSLTDVKVYTNLSDSDLDQAHIERRNALLDIKSDYFEILSDGAIDLEGMRKQVTATVKRDSSTGKPEILSWKIE